MGSLADRLEHTGRTESEAMVDRRVRAGYAEGQSRTLLAELRATHSPSTLPAALAHHGYISKGAAARREP